MVYGTVFFDGKSPKAANIFANSTSFAYWGLSDTNLTAFETGCAQAWREHLEAEGGALDLQIFVGKDALPVPILFNMGSSGNVTAGDDRKTLEQLSMWYNWMQYKRGFGERILPLRLIRINKIGPNVKYVDPTPLFNSDGRSQQHWSKVEGPFQSFELLDRTRDIENISGKESKLEIDTCGFAVHHWPVQEGAFANEETIRSEYYPQVEELLCKKLPGTVKKIVIFDHTLRQMKKDSLRKPVMQVHVDQTAEAATARVRRHLPSAEAEDLLKGRYSLINVWRPIGNPAIEYPLAALDWRTLSPEDFVYVDLMYPVRDREQIDSDDHD